MSPITPTVYGGYNSDQLKRPMTLNERASERASGRSINLGIRTRQTKNGECRMLKVVSVFTARENKKEKKHRRIHDSDSFLHNTTLTTRDLLHS